MKSPIVGILALTQMYDMDAGAKGEQLLGDLRERSHDIEKRTGKAPLSWIEFNREQPQEKPKTLRNAIIGALVGAALVAGVILAFSLPGISMIASVGIGAIGGALFGAATDSDNLRRSGQVHKYENYLNRFEELGGHGAARGPAQGAGKDTRMPQRKKRGSRTVRGHLANNQEVGAVNRLMRCFIRWISQLICTSAPAVPLCICAIWRRHSDSR